jgi:hypothetical protein
MKIKKIFEYQKDKLWEPNDNWASWTTDGFIKELDVEYTIVDFNKVDIKSIGEYVNTLGSGEYIEIEYREILIRVPEYVVVVIYKVEDDYFFVSDEGNGGGYKCDTVEGVIQLFDEKIFKYSVRLDREGAKLKEMKLKLMNYYNNVRISDIESLEKIIKIIDNK